MARPAATHQGLLLLLLLVKELRQTGQAGRQQQCIRKQRSTAVGAETTAGQQKPAKDSKGTTTRSLHPLRIQGCPPALCRH
jgi:hypothetical protein